MKNIRIFALAIFATLLCFNELSALTIDDYVLPIKTPMAPQKMISSVDGESYYQLKDNAIIEKISYKTGTVLEVVFDTSKARNCTVKHWDGFQISDDETKILLYTNKTPIYRNSFNADYYVFEIKRNNVKPLSSGGMQQAATFSHDGRMVAFVRNNNVYLAKLDYGTEVQVTTDGEKNKIINGVGDWVYQEEFGMLNSITFSADDLMLSYIRWDETNVKNYDLPIYEGVCNPNSQYAQYPGTFTYKYPVAGTANSKVKVLSYDVETRKTKELNIPIGEEDYIPKIEFSPVANKLMVTTINRNQNLLKIFAVNPRSTVAKMVFSDESTTWINIDNVTKMTRFYHDFFIVPSEKSGFNHLYKYSMEGAFMQQITNGKWEVTDFYGFDNVNKSYYFQTTQDGAINRTIAKIDAKGIMSRVSNQVGWNIASFNNTFTYCMINFSDIATPNRYTMWSKGKKVRDIEMNENYASKYNENVVPRKEFFTFSSDGNTFNGFTIRPLNFDPAKKYPVIMTQYSGPGSQQVINSWKIDWEQYAASQGYIVACIDGRGTGGRGKEWESIVYMHLGRYESIDQVAAAKYMASLTYVDSSKIGIFGWSYGGYETLMAMSKTDSPYAAGVAVAPVTDWRYYDTVYSERYMRTPQENETGYNGSSAIEAIPAQKGRLLLISGTADDNVHIANTLQYSAAMTSQDKICDMMIYTNMNHSINGCGVRRQLYKRIIDFYNINLKK